MRTFSLMQTRSYTRGERAGAFAHTHTHTHTNRERERERERETHARTHTHTHTHVICTNAAQRAAAIFLVLAENVFSNI